MASSCDEIKHIDTKSSMFVQTKRKPNVIIIFSGKRKSGKDYISNLLLQKLGTELSVIVRLSGPLKEKYATENNLDYSKLLEASNYKEVYRERMIKWGESIRNQDPSYFCRHAIIQSGASTKDVWIVSDARRVSDIEYFILNFGERVFTIRIEASDSVREQRGWEFKKGVDDIESECGLDHYQNWNYTVENNSKDQVSKFIDEISTIVAKAAD